MTNWHTITPLNDNVFRISEPIAAVEPRLGFSTVNVYLVLGDQRAALIDSGMGIGDLAEEVRKLTGLPCRVLNTHYHWDHVGANARFAETAIHESEAGLVEQEQDVGFVRESMSSPTARKALPPGFDPAQFRIVPRPATHVLQDNDEIDLGGRRLQVIHTPGHSPGHVAFFDEAHGTLFTGDTAYSGPLYACFSRSDPQDFARSTKRLAGLRGVRLICPGHNDLITESGWLDELAENAQAAVTGAAASRRREGFITGRECRFGDLSVWLPV